NLSRTKKLKECLAEFRKKFPKDYKPWQLSAHYYLELEEVEKSLDFAKHAYKLSKDYPDLKYYPTEQWSLEKRSASTNAAETYAKVLLEKKRFKKAVKILKKEIKNNKLGTEDEKNTAGLHYLLAASYWKLSKKDLAVNNASIALQKGDRENVFSKKAELLLEEITALAGKNLLKYLRQKQNYTDVVFCEDNNNLNLQNIKAKRIAWGDFNRDGYDDILVDGNRIFQNIKGEIFIEVTDSIYTNAPNSNGGLWADFNNDNFLDIITKDPEQIFGQKQGKFVLLTDLDNNVSSEGLAVGDVNNDGWLDIYVANYENREKGSTNYLQDDFYVNQNGEKFYPAADRADLTNLEPKAGRGVNMCDFDLDNDLDIYVSNYRLSPNFLWENDGSGHFKNIAEKLNLAGEIKDGYWGHTIGSEWGDFDSDGDFDLICCNLAHPRYIDFSNKTMLFKNNDGQFIDIHSKAGIKFAETHSEPCWADFNNDGYLDLYITSVYPNRRSYLYMNKADRTFYDVTFLSGVRYFNGWGVACSDFDNDGDLDLAVAGENLKIYRNNTSSKHNWLQFQVVGKDHSDAIGSKIIVNHENITQIREIQGGKGTTNQHSLIQHFGIPSPIKEVIIIFPNGEKKVLYNIELNKLHVIYE
ncbi:MAG: FG-GAP-like repeat-containing protein, partial [Candidatus Cloacimonadota bacterium]|nr:FG-GAP-like repeat-containing protein [Candidatus Cloacimonadota bacterium]